MFVRIGDDHTFRAKTVRTPRAIARGMMDKTFQDIGADAMVFVMKNSGEHNFHTKNCIVPLDILFTHECTITKIHRNCPPCSDEECKTYPGRGDRVIEMLGSTCSRMGIHEGDPVRFTCASLKALTCAPGTRRGSRRYRNRRPCARTTRRSGHRCRG